MVRLDLNYEVKEHIITKDNIGEFKLLEARRRIREGQKNIIKQILSDGEHFDSPIIVNQKSGKRIIDGQHRITAIHEVIKNNKEFQIKVLLVTYRGLSASKEREIFKKWNSGTKQTSDDYIQMFSDELPILKMLKNLPVRITIYKEPTGLHLKKILGAYVSAKNQLVSGRTGSNATFIDELKELNNGDAGKIKEFVEKFIENFGEINKQNIFAHTTPMNAMMYHFLNNYSENFWEKLSKIKEDDYIKEFCVLGGTMATTKMINKVEEYVGKVELEEKLFGVKMDEEIKKRNWKTLKVRKRPEFKVDNGLDIDEAFEGEEELNDLDKDWAEELEEEDD